MRGFNKAIIMGNLARDPELRVLPAVSALHFRPSRIQRLPTRAARLPPPSPRICRLLTPQFPARSKRTSRSNPLIAA